VDSTKPRTASAAAALSKSPNNKNLADSSGDGGDSEVDKIKTELVREREITNCLRKELASCVSR
jgi:hypothetical protein